MSFFLAKVGAAGTLFGAALAASGVYSPSIIIAQMQLKDFHMLKVFLGASASSALIIVLFEQLGLSKCSPRTPSSLGWINKYDGNILGGLLIGTGMALTGACPGTSLVQLAAGVRSGAFVVLGGMIAGAVYAKTSKYLRRSSSSDTASPNEVHTVYEKLDVSRGTTVTIYEMMCILVVTMAMHFTAPRRDTLPSALGGLLIGGAQAGSLLLTGNLVGVSGAYQELGNLFWHTLESAQNVDSKSKTQVTYKSIVFAAGVMAGSWTVLTCIPSLMITGNVQVSGLRALAGGFSMVFGARIAGGCTSGHGISGMSLLSISSFITVASMFGGGMGLAAILSH